MPAQKGELHLLANCARTSFAQRRRKLLLPKVPRLHDVVVDGDHQRKIVLGGSD
jgi:hypothetical protein